MTQTKGPPQNLYNIEAEQAVLSSMLHNNACIAEVRTVLGGSYAFYVAAHQKLFDLILKLLRVGPVDLVILGDAVGKGGLVKELRGGYGYLAELWNFPASGHPASYAGIVRDKWLRRRAINLASEFLRDVETGRPISELLLAHAEAARHLWDESRLGLRGPHMARKA